MLKCQIGLNNSEGNMNLDKSQEYQKEINELIHENIDFNILKDKNVLITGARGLIGSFLIDVLMLCNKVKKLNIKIYAFLLLIIYIYLHQ